MPRLTNVADKHVAARLRAARLEAGKTQTEVAESLGLTFQQIQKYEKGSNRISAGALHELSRSLDKPVQFFFDGLDGAKADRPNIKDAVGSLTRFGGTSEGMRIVRAFEKADPQLRRILAKHVEDLVRAASR